MGKADSTWSSTIDIDFEEHAFFDPNDRKYKCMCNSMHSTNGLRTIAGFLLLSVALEVYHLVWHIATAEDANDRLLSGVFQLLIGAAITGSVCWAIKSENALFLSAYLLLQTLGLAASMVIFVALLYIAISNDLDTMRSFLESQIPDAVLDGLQPRSLALFGWALVISAAAVLSLQLWLVRVVFSCWRYYRDKKEFGYSSKNSKSLVVLYPTAKEKQSASHFHEFIRSKSAEEFPNRIHRPLTTALSYGYSPRETVIIA